MPTEEDHYEPTVPDLVGDYQEPIEEHFEQPTTSNDLGYEEMPGLEGVPVEEEHYQTPVEEHYETPIEEHYEQPTIEQPAVEEHYDQPAIEEGPMDVMTMPNLRGYDEQPVAEELPTGLEMPTEEGHYEQPAKEHYEIPGAIDNTLGYEEMPTIEQAPIAEEHYEQPAVEESPSLRGYDEQPTEELPTGLEMPTEEDHYEPVPDLVGDYQEPIEEHFEQPVAEEHYEQPSTEESPNLRTNDDQTAIEEARAAYEEAYGNPDTMEAPTTVEEHYEQPAEELPTGAEQITSTAEQPAVETLEDFGVEVPAQEQHEMEQAELVVEEPLMVGGDESSLPPPEWILYGPDSMEEAPVTSLRGSDYPFSPASSVVPPFWALDFDNSGFVSPHEWGNYVETLKGLALADVAKTRDGWALEMLTNIVNYHYANLGDCIGQHFTEVNANDMSEDTFEPFGAWVQGNCYVKFRYSLFAGLPPFEWISRWEPTATAAQIESWFTDKLDTARADLANNRVFGITAESVVMHEAVVKCVYDYLQKDSSAVIDRDAFYLALNEIIGCAAGSA